MNHAGGPPWERLIVGLVALAIGLQLLAAALPRLVVPLLAVGGLAAILRLVWFFTTRW
jgi:hypothetical protein